MKAWLAALGALLLLAGRLSEPLLVQHVFCEHGELTHLVASPHGDVQDDSAASRARRAGEPKRSPARRAHHEHCDAFATHHLAADSAPFVATATLLIELPAEGGQAVAARQPIPTLWLAPKTSPPTG